MADSQHIVLVSSPGRCKPDGAYHATPPEGLARLVSWLQARGRRVSVVDSLIEGHSERRPDGASMRYGLSGAEVSRRVAALQPDLIGLSCPFTCTAPDVLEIAKLCRRERPQTPILLGGPHAALNAESILLQEPSVDYVALGEGEVTLAALADELRPGGDPERAPGLAVRTGSGVTRRAMPGLIDLDSLPRPAWDLFDLDAYARAAAPHSGLGSGRRFVPITISRGCRRSCAYCASPQFWGRGQLRTRSPTSVLDEIAWLVSAFGVEEIHLEDDCLLADKEWFLDVLGALADSTIALRLELPNGLDASRMDSRTAALLARAGITRVHLSFEAGPVEVRRHGMSRRLTRDVALAAVRALQEHGLSVRGYFMLGFPGQTVSDMDATVDFALSLGLDDLALFIVTPFPGTPLHESCRREGWLVDADRLIDFRLSVGHIRTADFGPEDTERLRRAGWEAFHAGRHRER